MSINSKKVLPKKILKRKKKDQSIILFLLSLKLFSLFFFLHICKYIRLLHDTLILKHWLLYDIRENFTKNAKKKAKNYSHNEKYHSSLNVIGDIFRNNFFFLVIDRRYWKEIFMLPESCRFSQNFTYPTSPYRKKSLTHNHYH